MARTQTVAQCVADAYQLATGKSGGLVAATTKYNRILGLLNFYTQEWANSWQWRSIRNTFNVVATVSATDTFLIPATMGHPSRQEGDFVRINHVGGVNESQYTILDIEKLYDDGPIVNAAGNATFNSVGTCAIVGNNLVFSVPFTATSAQFGGTIKIPGYSIPATLTGDTDTVTVDDPSWLAARAAAEYIRNDVTRVQLYNSLLNQANDKWETMKKNNRSQQDQVYVGGYRPPGADWE